jgi:hypothetical protein
MSSSLLIPTALGLLLFLLHTVTSSDEQDGTLRLIHVIFRHGHRTPADTYPNDPYAKHSFEPFGWGQLTNVSVCFKVCPNIVDRPSIDEVNLCCGGSVDCVRTHLNIWILLVLIPISPSKSFTHILGTYLVDIIMKVAASRLLFRIKLA